MLHLLLFCLLLVLCASAQQAPQMRVAIVGSGIGGASLAHFLQKQWPDRFSVTVFERSGEIGGRTRTLDFGGYPIDAGASVIHKQNKYLVDFAQELGLAQKGDIYSGPKTVGIFDGSKYVFRSSPLPVRHAFFFQ
jgi:prenylcysteine oxidase / farnesylcysteine lyase